MPAGRWGPRRRPAAMSARTMSRWPSATAHISAVSWVAAVAASTPAPCREQGLDRVEAARARGNHQRRQAVGLGGAGVRARGEEPVHQGVARVLAGPRERRHAVVVGGIGVGAGGEQQLDGRRVVPVGGPRAAPSRRRRAPCPGRAPRSRAGRGRARCRGPPSRLPDAGPAAPQPRCRPRPRGRRDTSR